MTKISKALLSLAALPLACAASQANAATEFQTNFDSVVIPAGSYAIVTSVEGWTAASGAGIEIQNHAAGNPFSESNLVELDSDNNSSMSRIIEGGSYVLDFLYSARPGVPASSNGISVLLNGSSIFNVTGDGGAGTNWLAQQVTFTAAAGSTLTFAATGTSDSLGGYLDNVRLSAAVPEPATWALMLMGFGGMGVAMRRRRAQGTLPQVA